MTRPEFALIQLVDKQRRHREEDYGSEINTVLAFWSMHNPYDVELYENVISALCSTSDLDWEDLYNMIPVSEEEEKANGD